MLIEYWVVGFHSDCYEEMRKRDVFVDDHHIVPPPLLQMDNPRPREPGQSSRVRIKIEVSLFVHSAKMNEQLYTLGCLSVARPS